MKALKILVVCNRLPWPLNDGGNIASYHVLRQLVQAGHGVQLASLNTRKHRQDPGVLQGLLPVHTVDIDTSVSAFGLLKGLFDPQPYNVYRFWSEEFASLLKRLLHAHDFDIVQFEGSYLALYSDTVRQHSRAKLILRAHNVEHVIWKRLAQAESNPLKRFYLQKLSPKIERFELAHLQDFDAIVPIASQDEAYYRENGYIKALQTINGGVDLQRFVPPADWKFRPQICFLGSLEWLPNVQGLNWLLEKVWPELSRRFPQAELHVAGKNPPAGFLQHPPAGVTMHGMVEDAAEFLQKGHIFVVPLLSGGGMRMKILEAMAAGMCVLSTRVGAEGIAYTEGQDMLVADDPQGWIANLDDLLTGKTDSLAVARAGRRLAEARYGWEAIGRQFQAFYAEVLA